MPRPAGGYRNAAGEAIPGTHDPIYRFMDQTALKIWAYNQGKKGLPLWGRADLDIGSCVHDMGELDLKGAPDREIEAKANSWLAAVEHLQKAWTCFREFRNWREQCQVRLVCSEQSLVSEVYQFGGTPDWILMFGNMGGALGLTDCKSSSSGKSYPDMRVAMAAHGKLWEENHPDKPLRAGHHLLLLPKDGSRFRHEPYSDLTLEWEIFTRYLDCYRLEKEGLARLKAQKVASKAAAKEAAQAARPAQASPRRRAAAATAIPPRPATLAEMLRHYGHVPEYA